jgi:dephospho-CoA kinase
MLKIGLTGGIGSGKSTACEYFANLDVPIIDTDIIARDLVRPGQPALEKIKNTFGNDIFDSMGNLDRIKLRDMIFDDTAKRLQLEAILHPEIKQEILRSLSTITTTYCIIVIPLLIEVGWHNVVDRILIIDTTPELQIQRCKKRNNYSLPQIKAIMATQVDRKNRISAADDIIINDNNLSQLEKQALNLHHKYLEMGAY